MAVAVNKPSGFWGEYSKPKNKTVKIGKHRWKKDHFHNVKQPCNTNELSENEKLLLLDEFKSHMIHKFLNGQEDFDYKYILFISNKCIQLYNYFSFYTATLTIIQNMIT